VIEVGHVVTTGSKGQIVIPVQLRRQLGLEPGQKVEVTVEGDAVKVRPIPRNLIDALTGCLRDGPSLTAALIREHAEEIERDEARSR
jgi:AbrB family looped-hinge helix DNA binding protein